MRAPAVSDFSWHALTAFVAAYGVVEWLVRGWGSASAPGSPLHELYSRQGPLLSVATGLLYAALIFVFAQTTMPLLEAYGPASVAAAVRAHPVASFLAVLVATQWLCDLKLAAVVRNVDTTNMPRSNFVGALQAFLQRTGWVAPLLANTAYMLSLAALTAALLRFGTEGDAAALVLTAAYAWVATTF